MKILWRALAWGLAICLVGCAGPVLEERSRTAPVVSPQAAMAGIVIGQSSKADVVAALGTAIVIPFDSAYEVWVYRWHGADKTPRAATELVLLFEPSGRLAKARVRPGYASRE